MGPVDGGAGAFGAGPDAADAEEAPPRLPAYGRPLLADDGQRRPFGDPPGACNAAPFRSLGLELSKPTLQQGVAQAQVHVGLVHWRRQATEAF